MGYPTVNMEHKRRSVQTSEDGDENVHKETVHVAAQLNGVRIETEFLELDVTECSHSRTLAGCVPIEPSSSEFNLTVSNPLSLRAHRMDAV